MRRSSRLLFAIFCCLLSGICHARTVNPLQYGLREARNSIERYEVLLRCHKDAVLNGYNISYKRIDSIRIELPRNYSSIPLTDNVDFSGVTIIVENRQKDGFLFDMRAEVTDITLTGKVIDSGLFVNYKELSRGMYMLIIEDKEPWSIRKSGTPFIRKDIILVKDGKAMNKPTMGYSSSISKPITKYRKIDNKKRYIKNLNFIRTSSSTRKTYCFEIENQHNVVVSNISITTPQNTDLYGDAAMHLDNCADVTLNNIRVNGTYSKTDKFGYGVGMVNIYKLALNKMYARCDWGVLGSQSLNNVVLKDCDINRFDIHCYGRDIRAEKCKFSGLYNQLSSVYGTVMFNKCEFVDFIPLLIESSYNAYTPFELIWKDCVFHLDERHNYILTLFGVPAVINERPELSRKSLPNITMNNCEVFLTETTKEWILVKTGGLHYKEPLDYITDIYIKNLKTRGSNSAEFKLFSEDVVTTNNVNIQIK